MKVAITGAAGYVGGLLVHAHAARGDNVHATARTADSVAALPGVTRYGADIMSPAALPDEFFDGAAVLYHCAAEIAREPLMHAVNVEATRRLLARTRGRIGHWVQVSSLSVYGTPRAGVVDEKTPERPRSTYALTKRDAERMVAANADAFSHTIVRPSAVIGRGMRTRSIYALIEAIARGRFCFIGAPGAIGNYIHEENLTEALMLCATREQAKGRTYVVSQNCTIEAMVEAIRSATGSVHRLHRMPESIARIVAQIATIAPAFPLTSARVDALTSRVEYSTAAIERELGYRHRRTIEDALRELVALSKGVTA